MTEQMSTTNGESKFGCACSGDKPHDVQGKTKKPPANEDREVLREARRVIPKLQRAARGLPPRRGCKTHKGQGYFKPGCAECERAIEHNMGRLREFIRRLRNIE